MGEYADEYPGTGSGKGGRIHSCTLKRLPCECKQKPLLRIHCCGLPAGNVEKMSIELINVMNESAMPRNNSPLFFLIRIIVLVYIPAIPGDFGDGAGSVTKELPKMIRIFTSPWKPACHADNSYRIFREYMVGTH